MRHGIIAAMNPFRRLSTVARSVESVAQVDIDALALDLRVAAQDHAAAMSQIAAAVLVYGAVIAAAAILYVCLDR